MSRDKTMLHPEVQEALAKLEAECKKQGLKFLATDCFRTKAEQEALYAKGRTQPGGIVTNARYPKSAHNWGVAVDFCQNIRGQEYSDPVFFQNVATIAKRMGFTWGGDWKNFPDRPHLEWAEFMPGSSVAYLLATYGTPEKFRETWGKESKPDYAEEVCKKLGLAQETRDYLDKYRFASDLWEKIWKGLK